MNRIFFLLLSLFIVGCETLNKTVEETFGQKKIKELCDETFCTDSLCLHWDYSLHRCGTASALEKERLWRNREMSNLLMFNEKDARKQQLYEIRREAEEEDSLTRGIMFMLESNEKRIDTIYHKIRVKKIGDYLSRLWLYGEK